MRTPKQQARRDAMARAVWALRPFLQTPVCPDCGGTGWRKEKVTLDVYGGLRWPGFNTTRIVKCDCSRATRSGPTALALEIVKNAWTPYEGGDSPYPLLLALIKHRVNQGWLMCAEPHRAALAGAFEMPKRGPCDACGRNSCDPDETICPECRQ